jgi:hypothetical protein
MNLITRIMLILMCLTGSFTAGTIAHAASARAAVTATPGQEWAACSAAYGLRGHQLEHAPVPSGAWWWTWRQADHADPGMRHDIHVWMLTGRAWFRVRYDCNPDA